MSIKTQKAEKKRLYNLGWYEDDRENGSYVWRCSSCDEEMCLVQCNCGICKGGCEECLGRNFESID